MILESTTEGPMRKFLVAVSAVAMFATAVPATAAPSCRDAKGKFIKCPPKAAAAPKKCRDMKGRFAKCGTPGAKPI